MARNKYSRGTAFISFIISGATACGGGENIFASDSNNPSNPTGGNSGAPVDGAAPVPKCDVAVGGTPKMVSVPAGEFVMGCNEAVDGSCGVDEKPMRTVSVSAFQIDVTEVTQDQFMHCVQQGSCAAPSCQWNCEARNLPATCITRAQAQSYCSWAEKRLPTEAQWEKAARGTDGRKFPWGNGEPNCSLVNMAGCNGGPTPVGSFPAGAGPYGALDMAGNMVEIVADWYDEGYYQYGPAVDPAGPASGNVFVGRGGGFKSDAYWHRTSVRDWYDPMDAGMSLGFRCAR